MGQFANSLIQNLLDKLEEQKTVALTKEQLSQVGFVKQPTTTTTTRLLTLENPLVLEDRRQEEERCVNGHDDAKRERVFYVREQELDVIINTVYQRFSLIVASQEQRLAAETRDVRDERDRLRARLVEQEHVNKNYADMIDEMYTISHDIRKNLASIDQQLDEHLVKRPRNPRPPPLTEEEEDEEPF